MCSLRKAAVHRGYAAAAATALLLIHACVEEEPTGVGGHTSNVIREYANGCPVEVIETRSEDTDTILVTFDGPASDGCIPKLAQWGIDMADPVAVDTPQGNQLYQLNHSNMANLPPSPSGAGLQTNAVRVTNGSPPQVMIEFDPPVSSAEFYYSFPYGGRAYWNGTIEDPTDSMMVYAMSRVPGTLSYDTWASKKLYANNPTLASPAVWSVWTPVKLATSQDRIQWLWFNGIASIDHLKITRTPMRCTPSTVQPGQTVSCVVNGSNYQVNKWEFYVDGEPQTTGAAARSSDGESMALTTLAQSPTIEWVSSSKTWAGPVGVGGTVRAHVTDQAGNPRALTSRFAVAYPSSPWPLTWRYRRGTTPPTKLTVRDHDPTALADTMGQNCAEQSCLLSKRLQPDAQDSIAKAITPLAVTVGPNMTFWIIQAIHFNMERVGNLNPGMLSTGSYTHQFLLPSTTPRVCRRGLGVSNKATTATANWWLFNNACGDSTLTGRNMTDWVDGVWFHEEFGRPPTGVGHESAARAEAGKSNNDPYVAIHQFWARDSAGLIDAVRTATIPISDRITIAAAHPNPKNNLVVTGVSIWYWNNAIGGWSLHPLDGPDL